MREDQAREPVGLHTGRLAIGPLDRHDGQVVAVREVERLDRLRHRLALAGAALRQLHNRTGGLRNVSA